MKKKILKSIFVVIGVIIIFLLPLVIEKIILYKLSSLVDINNHFTEETWFGFIASYLGVVGTVLLGIIALYQNRKYKELSDSSEERFMALQEEIRNLTEKSVSLIELNSKLERAKYYPILSNIGGYTISLNGKEFLQSVDINNDSFQISIKSNNINELLNTNIFEQYYITSCSLKNESEKTIRNFICTGVIINNQKDEIVAGFYQSCDIEPGAVLRCVYATECDLLQQFITGNIQSLLFMYRMENVIGELFELAIEFIFISYDENKGPSFFVEKLPIKKINSE